MKSSHAFLLWSALGCCSCVALGCDDDPANHTAPDGGPGSDGGLAADGGSGVDAAACRPLDPWTPIDTGGPVGESISQCVGRLGGSQTEDAVPDDQLYGLTTFGGPGDQQPVACNGQPDADATWFYAANAQRFPCGSAFRLVNAERTACAIVRVADIGPHICVEEAAAMPLWDVSPLAAEALVGQSSVGWSEGIFVYGAEVVASSALGPCNHVDTVPTGAGFVGGPCTNDGECGFAGGRCERADDGFPGGHCTAECQSTCPQREGAFALSVCGAPTGPSTCVSRCDFTLYAGGCRDGYSCLPRESATDTPLVCLPVLCL